MSGYSTKKEDDGSHSVIDSLGFRTPYTGLSEADASYHAQRLNKEEDQGNNNTGSAEGRGNDNTGSTNGTGTSEGSTPNQLSGKKTELGIFGKIFTFLGCAVLLIVGIFVIAGIIGWAIATFAVK